MKSEIRKLEILRFQFLEKYQWINSACERPLEALCVPVYDRKLQRSLQSLHIYVTLRYWHDAYGTRNPVALFNLNTITRMNIFLSYLLCLIQNNPIMQVHFTVEITLITWPAVDVIDNFQYNYLCYAEIKHSDWMLAVMWLVLPIRVLCMNIA